MAKQLRTLLLHNVISPYRLPVFEELSKDLDLEVYFCKDKTADRKWDTSHSEYTFKRYVLPSFKVGPFFINPTLLWQLLRNKYDVYLVGDFPEMAFATFITIAVAKLHRRPTVLWSETIDHEVIYFQQLAKSPRLHHRIIQSFMTGVVTGYRRLLLKLPNRYVALSAMAKSFLENEGVGQELIHSGIQVMPKQLLDPPDIDKSSGPYADKKLVLYLGYFNPLKGIDTLISAFGKIKDPKTRLAIVGTGPEEAKLKELAAQDERIDFYGYTAGVARANLMAWADVMVLPTLSDCWGFVVNESLYYGTPVISTSAAGASELIHEGQNGMVIPPKDEQVLAEALISLLANSTIKRDVTNDKLHMRESMINLKVGAAPILGAIMSAGGRAQ